jgi:hypothetical protein
MKIDLKLTSVPRPSPGAEAKGESGFYRLSNKANGITRDLADCNFIN